MQIYTDSVTELPVPDLSDAAVIRAVAGIRPCRRGGLRLEAEHIEGKTIVHNYGHGGCGVTLALGTAEVAAKLVAREDPEAPVAVLGGGVIGLAAALELVQHGHRVRIYAERAGVNTTSALAGALWLPTGLDFPDDPDERRHLNSILRIAGERLRGLDGARWGIETLPVFEPAGSPYCEHHFESGAIQRPTPIAELPVGVARGPGGVFRTLFVHTPRFLSRLITELRGHGVEIEKRRFTSIEDVLALPEPIVVNAMALGSREVFGDQAMYPARGVLVHLEPQRLGYVIHDGYQYMFPREDALILGGTFEAGEANNTPPEETAREILNHHRAFFGCEA